MAIPKVIYQTFKTGTLPLVNRLAIRWLKIVNPGYRYEFYDDARITQFLADEFPPEISAAYHRLNIGAAKADFFRYCILYKKGGVYLDIDAYAFRSLSRIIRPGDVAVISKEKFPDIFVQWALIYEAGHPFLKRAIEKVQENIAANAYPHSVHGMTGPTAYSMAILSCLAEDKTIPHRVFGLDYNKHIRPRLPMSRRLYKGELHWKKLEQITPVLKTAVIA